MKKIVLSTMLITSFAGAPAAPAVVVNSGDITSSITVIPIKGAAIEAIFSEWDEYFDGRSKFSYKFLRKYSSPTVAKDIYQSIPVYDGEDKVEIYRRRTADCIVESFQLQIQADGNASLITTSRAYIAGSLSVTPQNEPEVQRVTTYSLKRNEGQQHLPRAYFAKTKTRISKDKACTDAEINSLLLDTY
ncbi:MAG TPA: hypothetical protein VGM81_22465 [Burkholderiaceae bacterium]|jgi:hypothetical protein